YEYVIHSTYSYTPENPKLRVVLPLKRPVRADDWPDMWPRINERVFGGVNDPQTKDLARLSYKPSCRPGAPRIAEHHPGEVLDAYALPPVAGMGSNTAATSPT